MIVFIVQRRLLGGYDQLQNLRLEDVLQDLIGCVLSTLSFHDLPNASDLRRIEMFETLEQALSDGAIVLLCTKVCKLSLKSILFLTVQLSCWGI